MFYVFFSKSFEKEPKLLFFFSLKKVIQIIFPVPFFGAKKVTKEASTLSKPPPIWGGLTDYGQSPPSVRVLVSLASLCPTGERFHI